MSQLSCFCVGSCCLALTCCHSRSTQDENANSFHIIATDAGFEAPESVAAGLRHITYENHGSEIHEAMLVKLPEGMSASDYVSVVRAGSLSPRARSITPGRA